MRRSDARCSWPPLHARGPRSSSARIIRRHLTRADDTIAATLFLHFFERDYEVTGGSDLDSMMQQAQEMQEKMGREMKEMVVEASAGGGAVTVKMRGDFEVVEPHDLARSRKGRRRRDDPGPDRRRTQRSPPQGRRIAKRQARRNAAAGDYDVNALILS